MFVGAFAGAFDLHLESLAAALSVHLNERSFADALTALELSVPFLRTKALSFLLIPNQRGLAHALVLAVPFPRGLAMFAIVVDPSFGRLAKLAVFAVLGGEVEILLVADALGASLVQHEVLLCTAGLKPVVFFFLFLLQPVATGSHKGHQEYCYQQHLAKSQ